MNQEPSGEGYILALKPALSVYVGQTYVIEIGMKAAGGAIRLSGAGIASEGDWDDNLPLRMDGYDGYGGLYPLDLTFNMYWERLPRKIRAFYSHPGRSRLYHHQFQPPMGKPAPYSRTFPHDQPLLS